MSHTNQTANYHLPQFIGTDKPAWLVDFNQAMSDIDTQMKANETASGTAEANAQSALSGVTALNSQVGGIQTSVTALETQAPLDEAQIETNRQNIATNAQNIVDLDNRMGHTSIASIGDGTATGAIAEVQDEIGDLSQLQTTDKDSVVDAINEVLAGGGGDMSTVRYNNGWIEYTDDGGTTWHQLINVSTPNQLLPTMTSNVNPIGNASEISGSTNAYKAIDDSEPTYRFGLANNNEWLMFTFTVATFVQSISTLAYATGENTGLAIEYTVDGVNWVSTGSVSVDGTENTFSAGVNATIKALRVRKTMSQGSLYFGQIKAWN